MNICIQGTYACHSAKEILLSCYVISELADLHDIGPNVILV